MYLLITTSWTRTQGPTITINCPKCGVRGVSASTLGVEEKNTLFWFIPLFTTRYTNVSCENCGKTIRVVKPLSEVETLAPEALAESLATSVPFLIRFCIVTGIALFWAPFFGFVFNGIGLAATAKKPTAWKKAAIIGFILSVLPIVMLSLLPIIGMITAPFSAE